MINSISNVQPIYQKVGTQSVRRVPVIPSHKGAQSQHKNPPQEVQYFNENEALKFGFRGSNLDIRV